MHYALTYGLARNILLSSQSHEAVNTAAEAVLKLFRKSGGQPSLLRVAMDEDLVLTSLRPFHTIKVEQSLKDRFRASFRERMAIIGNSLGLPEQAVDDIVILETHVRPIAARIAQLLADGDPDEHRVEALVETLKAHLRSIDLQEATLPDEYQDGALFVQLAAQSLASRYAKVNGISGDRIDCLFKAARIGRDFVSSVSRGERSFESFLAGTRQIVVGTCVGLGRTSLGLTSTAFDLVIVDEAARCTASELLVPLQAARWAVLVGDHAQLQPLHKAEVVNEVAERIAIPKTEIQRSDFERVFSTAYGKLSGARLKTQYRMLPPIGALVSETFYQDLELVAGRTDPEIPPSSLPADLDKPLTWIETDSLGEAAYDRQPEDGNSRINRVEADAIIALVEEWHSHDPFRNWLLTQQTHPAGIGIICMYTAQRDLIRRRLRQSPLVYLLDQYLRVGTVDSYQGKENPIIMLSLVRNNDSGAFDNGLKRIREGFLSSPNRINVAASRAMDRLVIVGARRRWHGGSPVGRLVNAFARQEAAGEARAIDVQMLQNRSLYGTTGPNGRSKISKRPSIIADRGAYGQD